MTNTKYITLLALLGSSQANVQINVDDEKIENVGRDFLSWVGGEAQSVQAQRTAKMLNTLAHKAQLRIDLRQKAIFQPIVNNLQTYLKFVNQTNLDCDENVFIQCAIQNENSFLQASQSECSTQSKCNIAFAQMTPEEQQNVVTKLQMNAQDSQAQIEKVGQKIAVEFQDAVMKNQQSVMQVAQDSQKEVSQVLKDWGCEPTCVDQCTAFANFELFVTTGCVECDCPSPINIRQVFGNNYNYYQHQFESPAYNLYGYHGYHGSYGHSGYQYHSGHVPVHHYHYGGYSHPHHYGYQPYHVTHTYYHSYATENNKTDAATSLDKSEQDPSVHLYGYNGHNQFGPLPEGHPNFQANYGVPKYEPHQYHSYMDAFTVSNLLSSACDVQGLCGNENSSGFQALPMMNFPGFHIQGPAKNIGPQTRKVKDDSQTRGENHGAKISGGMPGDFPGFNIQGPKRNIGAQSKKVRDDSQSRGANHGAKISGGMPGMSFNSVNHMDAFFASKEMNGFGDQACDIPELCPGVGPSMGGWANHTGGKCDIPELCPGVGPSMGGAIEKMKLALICDIPELCPGVGPSMGGAIKDVKLALPQCDIPELCPGVGPSMGGAIEKMKLALAECDIPELCPGVGPSMGGAIKDMKQALATCDIPELCPGYGPSMGGAIENNRLALAVCDIPELCPGVGPSMGGFNVGKLQKLSACTIPELCIVGNDVTSLASEAETTMKFSKEEIQKFKKNQTFYSGIGISNNDQGRYIDFQKPYFAFKTVETTKSSWVSASAVLCSVGLVGAGYIAVTKKQGEDESFNVEMS